MQILAARSLRRACVLAATMSFPLAAQSGMPVPRTSDAQTMAMMGNALKLQHPAELVLEFTKELNLRPDQVTKLQQLVLDQRDSATARLNRPRPMTPGGPGMNAMTRAMMDWGSPVDEQAIRDAACEQSRATAEISLAMIHDQHAVGAILTEAQRSQIPMLQAKLMMRGIDKQP